jgi:hypothetical protein
MVGVLAVFLYLLNSCVIVFVIENGINITNQKSVSFDSNFFIQQKKSCFHTATRQINSSLRRISTSAENSPEVHSF